MSALRMPVVFFGHGSPMNALGGPNAEAWRALGATLPRPKAVLMVSAHWFIDEVAVTKNEQPKTIHDFYGFPQSLYEITYDAPGAPWLARMVGDLLAPEPVRQAEEWGLDHGTWSVLEHVFPDADVPVVQLSLDRRHGGRFHYDLARRLAPLREEGVLIAGSGDVVHNLRLMRRDGSDTPYDWAERFHNKTNAMIAAGDHEPLIDYLALGEDARLSAPTPEHYLPLLYVLAQQVRGEPVSFFNDRVELGSVSMTGVRIG